METGPEKYPLQGVDLRSHLICTPPRMGHPSWFPLVPSTGGYGPHPRRLIRTPVQGDYPRYHSITSLPRKGFSPGPLTPRVKRFPATRSCPLSFVYFLCDLVVRASKQKHCQLEELINCILCLVQLQMVIFDFEEVGNGTEHVAIATSKCEPSGIFCRVQHPCQISKVLFYYWWRYS